jgi:hypothetical protein
MVNGDRDDGLPTSGRAVFSQIAIALQGFFSLTFDAKELGVPDDARFGSKTLLLFTTSSRAASFDIVPGPPAKLLMQSVVGTPGTGIGDRDVDQSALLLPYPIVALSDGYMNLITNTASQYLITVFSQIASQYLIYRFQPNRKKVHGFYGRGRQCRP